MNTARNFSTLIATTIFGVLGSTLAALPAVAGSIDVPTSIVKYGDLDVSNPRGASVLYSRIHSAAEQLCSAFDRSDLGSKARLNACVHKAIAGAVTIVNLPQLSAVYYANYGMPEAIKVASLR